MRGRFYRAVVYLRPEFEHVNMVVSSQEAYFRLARSASLSRQEAISSCILFDPIPVLDGQPVANIVCMYDYYPYVACIILQASHCFSFKYLVNAMVLKNLKGEYRNSNLFAHEAHRSYKKKGKTLKHRIIFSLT